VLCFVSTSRDHRFALVLVLGTSTQSGRLVGVGCWLANFTYKCLSVRYALLVTPIEVPFLFVFLNISYVHTPRTPSQGGVYNTCTESEYHTSLLSLIFIIPYQLPREKRSVKRGDDERSIFVVIFVFVAISMAGHG
jgi:hypothetical protein